MRIGKDPDELFDLPPRPARRPAIFVWLDGERRTIVPDTQNVLPKSAPPAPRPVYAAVRDTNDQFIRSKRVNASLGRLKQRSFQWPDTMTTRRLPLRASFASILLAVVCAIGATSLVATPANKAALEKHYDQFLVKTLARCTTCHLPSENKSPESLEDFPHNAFGARLRAVGKPMAADGKTKDIPARLQSIAREDSDHDGVDNETELLSGHNPGDATDTPSKKELAEAKAKRGEFQKFLASYRWHPFEPVVRPKVPVVSKATGIRKPVDSPASFRIRNPIDAFIAAEHQARGLKPRPEAPKETLLRRVYLDLIGLSPTPEELAAFERDTSPNAYEKAVDRLLADPRHGERWARHWMDVWRYSDWAGWSGGNQIRDSQPHIWKWRDWIVESLNADKGYDRMLTEMLAADELTPLDTNALRATGFLVRNYKMLSREQWLEDTVKHTSQAFLGVTMGCAKCHDHMFDPISQKEYYQMRAIFEPHWVRTDPVPGDTNRLNAGLVRAYDTATNSLTYFLHRGDERKPDTNRIMDPGVPKSLGGALAVQPVALPWQAARPDHREFVYHDALAAAGAAVDQAKKKVATAPNETIAIERQLLLDIAQSQRDALAAVIETERLDDGEKKNSETWKAAATNAVVQQRLSSLADAKLKHFQSKTAEAEARTKAHDASGKLAAATNAVAEVSTNKAESIDTTKQAAEKTAKALAESQKKTGEAAKALADAEAKVNSPADVAFKPRGTQSYPTTSTGRRLALARWLASTNNPLTARVAANQIWLRHFGQAIVPSPNDFGRNGKPPSHPKLLDWLAAEFMARGWSTREMHRLIVTSSTYRMASTPDVANAKLDPDNIFLWRMNSRRMEAEVVRDNMLYVGGNLDLSMGGPDIDHNLGLKSKRRSIYLRQAAEKEVEFLKIFDGPAVTECYIRRPTVVPQQALAMANSELTTGEAKALAKRLSADSGEDPDAFARSAFERIIARRPTAAELSHCREFLQARTASSTPIRAREALVTVLFNHNDFVTIR